MRTRKPVPVHNLKVTRKGKVKKRSILWRWRRLFYLSALAVVVGAAGLIYVVGQVELPVDPTVAPDQDLTSFICDASVQVNCNATNALAQLHGAEDRVLVTYEQIPEVLRQAVLATEDKDFFEHGGVDPIGIARAAWSDIRGTGVRQGGSTITQQYVKQEYLTSEQTLVRKIKEAAMAVKLEQEISKEEILTRYLNTVYFGRGAYGVQAASRVWFGHDIVKLTAGEAAFLAGLLRNPNGAEPYASETRGNPKGIKEAARRRRVTLNLMVKEGYLKASEARAFDAVPTDPFDPSVPEDERFVQPPPKPSVLGEKVKGAAWGTEYFAEHVRKWLIETYGSEAVYGGGLKVYTTLDQNMQKAAYDAVTTTLDREGDPSGSIVAIDDQGHVKAMMGGTDFKNSEVNLATGRKGGGLGRQPGSTFKPFALAEAVREGYSIGSLIPAPSKVEITDPVCLNGGETHWPVKGGPGGPTSLLQATKRSTNTAYANLMVALGPEKVVKMAADLGVTAAETMTPFCSIVLGAGEVSVLDMAAGYSTFANEGTKKAPIVVTKVEFPDGTVDVYKATEEQVLTPVQAGRVTYALQQVISGGTGTSAAFGRPAAGKTGTAQNNADSWFVGYTPKLTAAVWMGHPEGLIPMKDVHGIEVEGGTFPAEMWRKFMQAATAGFDTGEFPEFSDEELTAGATLDVNVGKTTIYQSGSGGDGSTGYVPTTTQPQTSTPQTTVPQTSVPQTTVPQTAAPPTTVATTQPQTTQPAGGAGGGGGGGGGGTGDDG